MNARIARTEYIRKGILDYIASGKPWNDTIIAAHINVSNGCVSHARKNMGIPPSEYRRDSGVGVRGKVMSRRSAPKEDLSPQDESIPRIVMTSLMRLNGRAMVEDKYGNRHYILDGQYVPVQRIMREAGVI